jgi:hypothetical protein
LHIVSSSYLIIEPATNGKFIFISINHFLGAFIQLTITLIACATPLKISLIRCAQKNSNRVEVPIIGYAIRWTSIARFNGSMDV